jgi:hypothetical protein
MTKTFNKKKQCTRTKEGLVAHHKMENYASKLAEPIEAVKYPFEWQTAPNIVYCDYLEHFLLHILICESKLDNPLDGELVGIGGIIQYIIPELNDMYSGWKTTQGWRATCHSKVINDKDVYLTLIKRLTVNCKDYPHCNPELFLSSYNTQYGNWSKENNKALFNEIIKL